MTAFQKQIKEKAIGDTNLSAILKPSRASLPSYLDRSILSEVKTFHRSLPGYKATPLISLPNLSQELGVKEILIKDESYRFGLNAFKSLGVSYAIAKFLSKHYNFTDSPLTFNSLCHNHIRQKTANLTFISATDGNHGRGLAWFAEKIGARAVILMPKHSVKARVNAIKAHGAEVRVVDVNYDEAVRLANQLAKDNNWHIIQDTAWNGYREIPNWITQGYSTMACEALEQIGQNTNFSPSHVFVQAGVGSMAGAVLQILLNHYQGQSPCFYTMEPHAAACIYKSAKYNDSNPHTVEGDHRTIMAGLACGEPNIETWKILRDHASGYISCADSITEAGMQRLACPIGNDRQIVSGESGAVGVGVVENIMKEPSLQKLKETLSLNEESVILLFSTEGNTDPDNYNAIVEQRTAPHIRAT